MSGTPDEKVVAPQQDAGTRTPTIPGEETGKPREPEADPRPEQPAAESKPAPGTPEQPGQASGATDEETMTAPENDDQPIPLQDDAGEDGDPGEGSEEEEELQALSDEAADEAEAGDEAGQTSGDEAAEENPAPDVFTISADDEREFGAANQDTGSEFSFDDAGDDVIVADADIDFSVAPGDGSDAEVITIESGDEDTRENILTPVPEPGASADEDDEDDEDDDEDAEDDGDDEDDDADEDDADEDDADEDDADEDDEAVEVEADEDGGPVFEDDGPIGGEGTVDDNTDIEDAPVSLDEKPLGGIVVSDIDHDAIISPGDVSIEQGDNVSAGGPLDRFAFEAVVREDLPDGLGPIVFGSGDDEEDDDGGFTAIERVPLDPDVLTGQHTPPAVIFGEDDDEDDQDDGDDDDDDDDEEATLNRPIDFTTVTRAEPIQGFSWGVSQAGGFSVVETPEPAEGLAGELGGEFQKLGPPPFEDEGGKDVDEDDDFDDIF